MKRRNKSLSVLIIVCAAVILVAAPVIHVGPLVPNGCVGFGCFGLPDRYQSVTRYFLGFGGETDYGFQFYVFYFCLGPGPNAQGYFWIANNWEWSSGCFS